MRTSIEVPDDLFRKIRVHTAENGITFRQFILDSAEQALEASHRSSNNAWRSVFGVMADHSHEMERIKKRIDDEFEPIDPEEWK
jgi:hypothetical protein